MVSFLLSRRKSASMSCSGGCGSANPAHRAASVTVMKWSEQGILNWEAHLPKGGVKLIK